MVNGVVYVCNGFHQAKSQAQEDAEHLLRAVAARENCTERHISSAKRHGQQARKHAAADVAALRVFLLCVRHLKIVHAEGRKRQKHIGDGERRGKQPGIEDAELARRQPHHQNGKQPLTGKVGQRANCIPDEVAF